MGHELDQKLINDIFKLVQKHSRKARKVMTSIKFDVSKPMAEGSLYSTNGYAVTYKHFEDLRARRKEKANG